MPKSKLNISDSMKERIASGRAAIDDGDVCDYCGVTYNPDGEGHQHGEDCECEVCADSDNPPEKFYCSPECEWHDHFNCCEQRAA